MILQDHYFEPKKYAEIDGNGISPKSCRHCMRVPEAHPPHPDRPRDIEDEERIQSYAASLAPRLGSPQAAFASARGRAYPGPVKDADNRDNAREVREEVADAINYATWEYQKLERQDGSEASKMLWNGVIIKAVELWDAVVAAEHPEG